MEGKPRQECLLRFIERLNNNLEKSELHPSLEWKCNYITLKSSYSFLCCLARSPKVERRKGPLMTFINDLEDRTQHTISNFADDKKQGAMGDRPDGCHEDD